MKRLILTLLLTGLLFPVFGEVLNRDLVIYVDTGTSMRGDYEPNDDVDVYKEVASHIKLFLRDELRGEIGKRTNIQVIAVAKHRDRQHLDTSRVLLNISAGQDANYTNLTNITAKPDGWTSWGMDTTDENPTDLRLFYNDIFKDAQNKIYVVFTNSAINQEKFFNGNKAEKIGNLNIQKVLFPNNVKAYLVSLPGIASCGKNYFTKNECPKYVNYGLGTAWREPVCDPPGGTVSIKFDAADKVTKTIIFKEQEQDTPHFYAPVTLTLEGKELSDVASISSSKIGKIKGINVKVQAGKRDVSQCLGKIEQAGDYVITTIVNGRNGDRIERKISFKVHENIEVITDGKNASKTLRDVNYTAKAPDFKVHFPKYKNIKQIAWKLNGKTFDPEKNNVFKQDATVVAELKGFDGVTRFQKYNVTADKDVSRKKTTQPEIVVPTAPKKVAPAPKKVDFLAKANKIVMSEKTGKEISKISGGYPFTVKFTVNPDAKGAKWYKGGKSFIPKSKGDKFYKTTEVRCEFNGAQRFVKIEVPELELTGITSNNTEIPLTDDHVYIIKLSKGKTEAVITFTFNGSGFTVDDNEEPVTENEWQHSFKSGETKITFYREGKQIVCRVVVEKEEKKIVVPPDYQGGGDDPDYTWVIVVIIVILVVVGIVVLVRKLGGSKIQLELDGEVYGKTIAPGEYVIDQNMFQGCKDAFTIYLTMTKGDDYKDYFVKFKLNRDWELEDSRRNSLSLNDGESDELEVRGEEYTIYTSNGDSMKFRVDVKDNQ